MSQDVRDIGARVRARMGPGLSQRRLAELVPMPPDALSRALNGQRGFAPVELARIAEILSADLHWLITGEADPLRVDVAARHRWDAVTGSRSNPGREADDQIIARVVAAYREAFPDGPPQSSRLPSTPAGVREALGGDFVRSFSDVVEERLGVDVVRVQGLATDYSVRIGGRGVILLTATPHWFRSNWSLAHEIGHLALEHHERPDEQANEGPANAFAAELLLPEAVVRQVPWADLTEDLLARFVWDAGVSTEAVRNRLTSIGVGLPPDAASTLARATVSLLRRNGASLHARAGFGDPLTLRERDAAARRFPVTLLENLGHRVDKGDADPRTLAWVLDVPVDELDFPEPDDHVAAEAYDRMLADRPGVEEWARVMSERSPTTS